MRGIPIPVLRAKAVYVVWIILVGTISVETDVVACVFVKVFNLPKVVEIVDFVLETCRACVDKWSECARGIELWNGPQEAHGHVTVTEDNHIRMFLGVPEELLNDFTTGCTAKFSKRHQLLVSIWIRQKCHRVYADHLLLQHTHTVFPCLDSMD